MRGEVWALIGLVGASVWALRVLPLYMTLSRLAEGGKLARVIAATGVAAIATLFAAALLPEIGQGRGLPAAMGSLAVIAAYLISRSVVLSTLAGAATFGAVVAFFP